MVAAKLAMILVPFVLKHIADELGRPVAQALFPVFARLRVSRDNDAMVNVERMFAILETQGRVGEDVDDLASKPLIVSAGKIDFEQVDFSYDPARPILRRVD